MDVGFAVSNSARRQAFILFPAGAFWKIPCSLRLGYVVLSGRV